MKVTKTAIPYSSAVSLSIKEHSCRWASDVILWASCYRISKVRYPNMCMHSALTLKCRPYLIRSSKLKWHSYYPTLIGVKGVQYTELHGSYNLFVDLRNFNPKNQQLPAGRADGILPSFNRRTTGTIKHIITTAYTCP